MVEISFVQEVKQRRGLPETSCCVTNSCQMPRLQEGCCVMHFAAGSKRLLYLRKRCRVPQALKWKLTCAFFSQLYTTF